MVRQNEDVRSAARGENVRLWEVADALSISDTYFSKKLRHLLPASEKKRIFRVIEDIGAKKKGGDTQ